MFFVRAEQAAEAERMEDRRETVGVLRRGQVRSGQIKKIHGVH